MNFFDFIIETYDAKSVTLGRENECTVLRGTRGRPPNERIPYLPEYGKSGRCRIVRTLKHETLPNIVGKWFPRNDRAVERELYCASMLLLLRPWRFLGDLKHDNESFSSSFNGFELTANDELKEIMNNIQYYHECTDAAAQRRADERKGVQLDGIPSVITYEHSQPDEEMEIDINEERFSLKFVITEAMVEEARKNKEKVRERIYGQRAIEIAIQAGIFEEDNCRSASSNPIILARRANDKELEILARWDKELKKVTRRQLKTQGIINLANISEEIQIISKNVTSFATVYSNPIPQQEQHRPLLAKLNKRQRQAHDIIEHCLKKEISGNFVN